MSRLIAAIAIAAALPTAFAQSGPAPLRGEAYPAAASAAVAQAPAAMPEFDFVAGEAGYVPHQHEYMAQNELRARAMGHRGASTVAPRVQGTQEIGQYQRAGA